MADFLETLRSGKVLLMDGAMGTRLVEAGMRGDECPELWNLTHPERVRAVHQSYVDAGAQVLLTNTFQANPTRLKQGALLAEGPAICRVALELARMALSDKSQGERPWVLGDIGPMPEAPGGVSFPRPEPLRLMVDWLAGVDALFLETCSDWSVMDAARWIGEHSDLPVLISLSYRTDAAGEIRTWDNHRPEDFAREAKAAGVAALGVNCGLEQDMGKLAEVIRRFRSCTDLPLFARPNAGTPVRVGDRWRYPWGAEEMAKKLPELLAAGATMIGGCCGTGGEHMRAFKEVLTEWRERYT